MKQFLVVGLGGALGSMMRYGITLLVAVTAWSPLWGTLAANTLGSFLIGLCVSACSQGSWQLFLTVGLCGGFTTFSTFSTQNLNLLQDGRWGLALAYMLGTMLICLFVTWLGYGVGNKI